MNILSWSIKFKFSHVSKTINLICFNKTKQIYTLSGPTRGGGSRCCGLEARVSKTARDRLKQPTTKSYILPNFYFLIIKAAINWIEISV